MSITLILQILIIVSGVLIIASVLLQARGASLGAGFGSSGEFFTTRRGIDKNLYDTTIVLAIIFILSLLAGLLIS